MSEINFVVGSVGWMTGYLVDGSEEIMWWDITS